MIYYWLRLTLTLTEVLSDKSKHYTAVNLPYGLVSWNPRRIVKYLRLHLGLCCHCVLIQDIYASRFTKLVKSPILHYFVDLFLSLANCGKSV